MLFIFSYYTIVSPKVIRPNSDYLISVSVQYADAPTLVNLEIVGQQNSGGVFKASQSVSVDPFSTRIVRLEVRNRIDYYRRFVTTVYLTCDCLLFRSAILVQARTV